VESLGWNREVIIDAERARWHAFRENIAGVGPLGFSHETANASTTRNIAFHNIHLTYAYVLALVAHQRTQLSVLDWGGGLGHYYLIGRAMLPEVPLDYYCHEVPLMCKEGAQLCPEVHFCSDESCLTRVYDLVILNGSLGYFPDWKSTLVKLCKTAKSYLLLTRVFVVEQAPTFVILHRAYEHGYQADMLTQVFNRSELLNVIEERGFRILREFAVEDPPVISGISEPSVVTGWLFKKD
jgi:putative methyltransferase (TIGR04325 family)